MSTHFRKILVFSTPANCLFNWVLELSYSPYSIKSQPSVLEASIALQNKDFDCLFNYRLRSKHYANLRLDHPKSEGSSYNLNISIVIIPVAHWSSNNAIATSKSQYCNSTDSPTTVTAGNCLGSTVGVTSSGKSTVSEPLR